MSTEDVRRAAEHMVRRASLSVVTVGLLSKKIGEWSTVLLGMLAAAIAFIGTAFIHSELPLYGFLVFGSLAGVAGPAINSLMSRQVPDDAQGELQGAVQSIGSIAAIIGPPMYTQTLEKFSGPNAIYQLPGMPILLAAAISLVTLALFLKGAALLERRA